MAVSILFNGVSYTIPNVGDESWGEALTSLFVAIPQGALQKTGGAFTLTANVNFGATYGLLSQYFSTRTASPSTAGVVRLANSDAIGYRNAANSDNLLLTVNASNQLVFNGSAIYTGGITALTGDVTATGPGSVVATIANNVIVNAMVNSSAAIAYSKLNLATSILNSDISASAAIAFSKLATLASGNLLVGSAGGVATSVSVTGDVTISATGVTAIGVNKVTLAMMAQVATATFLGRTTASTGNVESLTVTQATALLNAFVGDSGSGGTKGLVPAPAAGDAAALKYLMADGTWAVPAGAGTVTSVAMSVPSILSVAGSPITTSGTFSVTLANQNANLGFYGPLAGAAAAPTFREPIHNDLLPAYIAPTIQRFTSGSGTYYLTYLFTVTAANATAADTYTNNGETFTVVETIAGGTTLRCTGTGAPDASGTLTKSAGSGDATITFSSVAKPVRLFVELVGGGGGGRGSGTTTSAGSGSNGNDSTFGSSFLTAGLGTGATGTGGAAGGTSTIASPAYGVTIPGGIGGTGFDTATTAIYAAGGFGGGTGLVSGTAGYLNVNAVAATANTGTGGAGAGNGSSVGNRAGGGGGGAGYLLAVIANPSASYAYSIGAGGGGGTAGTTGFIGGTGASGVCTVWEEYQ